MNEPELMFCEDGTIFSWKAQDGMLLVGIADAEESHEHRLVLAPEDLAPMLVGALRDSLTSVYRYDLLLALGEFMRRTDAQRANAQ